MKFPVAPLSMRILMGAWFNVPLTMSSLAVGRSSRLLMTSGSTAGACTSASGRESKGRSGFAGLEFDIFRGAWGALKIILFPTRQCPWLRWYGFGVVVGWEGDNL